jgi:hypothetical protein
MSYDLYCYRPRSNVPNTQEAEAILDAINPAEPSAQTSEELVSALISYNPRLERFAFDYAKIAELDKISEQEARERNPHIELNPPDDDIAIQLTVYADHVFIATPYWYKGTQADQVFSQLSAYLKVIRRTAGFFAYDPQTGVAFDPEITPLSDHRDYGRVVQDMPSIALKAVAGQKPWWKFW